MRRAFHGCLGLALSCGFLVAGGLMVTPSVASALSCSAPLLVLPVYPRPGATNVPPNAQIFLHTDEPRAARALRLVDADSGKRVRIRRVIAKRSGLVRLIPRKLLKSKRGYEVRRAGRRLLRFTAGVAVQNSSQPALSKVRLLFSKAGSVSMIRRAGRSARLLAKTVGLAPQLRVLEVVLRYRVPGRRRPLRRGVVLAVGPGNSDTVASRHACSRLFAAPAKGSYELEVRPWDATGVAGTVVKRRGTLTTAPDYHRAGRPASPVHRTAPKSVVRRRGS